MLDISNRENMNKIESGEVKFSNDVISSIVEIAINEVPGVKTSKTLVDKVMNTNALIKVAIMNSSEIDITISVNVEYGKNIPEIAVKVQDNVISNVEAMTGLSVKNINVNVDGLYIENDMKK